MEIEKFEYRMNYKLEILANKSEVKEVIKFVRPHDHEAMGRSEKELILDVSLKPYDYLTIKIISNDCDDGWIGNFEPGVEGLTGIFATPSEDIVCIVVKGQGYWVPVKSPKNYEIIPIIPIKEVKPVPGKNVMIFIDYLRIAAYGENGLLWKTKNLSWDGLKITEITQSKIKGLAWDMPNSKKVEFIVDVMTGLHEGGSNSEL